MVVNLSSNSYIPTGRKNAPIPQKSNPIPIDLYPRKRRLSNVNSRPHHCSITSRGAMSDFTLRVCGTVGTGKGKLGVMRHIAVIFSPRHHHTICTMQIRRSRFFDFRPQANVVLPRIVCVRGDKSTVLYRRKSEDSSSMVHKAEDVVRQGGVRKIT